MAEVRAWVVSRGRGDNGFGGLLTRCSRVRLRPRFRTWVRSASLPITRPVSRGVDRTPKTFVPQTILLTCGRRSVCEGAVGTTAGRVLPGQCTHGSFTGWEEGCETGRRVVRPGEVFPTEWYPHDFHPGCLRLDIVFGSISVSGPLVRVGSLRRSVSSLWGPVRGRGSDCEGSRGAVTEPHSQSYTLPLLRVTILVFLLYIDKGSGTRLPYLSPRSPKGVCRVSSRRVAKVQVPVASSFSEPVLEQFFGLRDGVLTGRMSSYSVLPPGTELRYSSSGLLGTQGTSWSLSVSRRAEERTHGVTEDQVCGGRWESRQRPVDTHLCPVWTREGVPL